MAQEKWLPTCSTSQCLLGMLMSPRHANVSSACQCLLDTPVSLRHANVSSTRQCLLGMPMSHRHKKCLLDMPMSPRHANIRHFGFCRCLMESITSRRTTVGNNNSIIIINIYILKFPSPSGLDCVTWLNECHVHHHEDVIQTR